MKLEFLFDWLVFTLIKLAVSADKQSILIDADDCGGDLADDFENYFGNYKNQFLADGLLDSGAMNQLEKLFKFFRERTDKDEYIEFWSDRNQLFTHADWNSVRQMAYDSLVAMKKEKYGVELKTRTDGSETKFKLVKRT